MLRFSAGGWIVLVLASLLPAQELPAPQASITVVPFAVNDNGSVTGIGVYGANPGWATVDLRLYIVENSPGSKFVVVTSCVPNLGMWTVTSQPLPKGSYTVWVFHNVKNGALVQTVTTAAQFIEIPANIIGPLPAPEMLLTWADGKPVRDANGVMIGAGRAPSPKGIDFDSAIDANFALYCLPVPGGVVDSTGAAFGFPRPNSWGPIALFGFPFPDRWGAHSNLAFPGHTLYHVIAIAHITKTPEKGPVSVQIVSTEMKLNQ